MSEPYEVRSCLADLGVTSLSFVPEPDAITLEAAGARIELDEDNSDYVCSVQDLATFASSKLKGLRYDVNRFWREAPPTTRIVQLPGDSPATGVALLDVFDAWTAALPGRREHSHLERDALRRLLEDAPNDLLVIGIEVDGAVHAFEISETIGDEWAISHFAKARPTNRWIARACIHATAQRLAAAGAAHWNWEQDLGIPGLRLEKQRNHSLMLRKYVVALTTD